MRKVLVVAACTMFFAAGPAHAQDVEKALKDFGLVGAWSADCGDKTKGRLTFTGGGKPTVAFTSPSADDDTGEGSITAAEIVSPTKFSVTVVPAKKNGKSIDPASSDAKPQTTVLEKVGNMIKLPSEKMLQKCVS